MKDRFELTIEKYFSASHSLNNYPGACANNHGHNWRVQLTISGEKLNELGILMDFREMKQVIDKYLDELDHTFINNHNYFKENKLNPSSENIAKFIYEGVENYLKDKHLKVESVLVGETPTCYAKYSKVID